MRALVCRSGRWNSDAHRHFAHPMAPEPPRRFVRSYPLVPGVGAGFAVERGSALPVPVHAQIIFRGAATCPLWVIHVISGAGSDFRFTP
jgi:hypothetical protein